MASSTRIDGLICNDFSPQARLAAALAKKLKAKPKIEPAKGVSAGIDRANQDAMKSPKYASLIKKQKDLAASAAEAKKKAGLNPVEYNAKYDDTPAAKSVRSQIEKTPEYAKIRKALYG